MKLSCSWYTIGINNNHVLIFITKEFVSYSYASNGNEFYSFDDLPIKERFILL